MTTALHYDTHVPDNVAAAAPGWLARATARRAGRKAYRDNLRPQTDGWFSYTRVLESRTHDKETQVSNAVAQLLKPIETDMLAFSVRIARARAQRDALIENAESEFEDSRGQVKGSLEAAAKSRNGSAGLDRARRALDDIDAFTDRLAEAVGARHALLGSGRAVVEGHAQHFAVLAGAHRDGFDHALSKASPSSEALIDLIPGPPQYRPRATWIDHDPDFSGTVPDQAVGEVIKWALKEFTPALSK